MRTPDARPVGETLHPDAALIDAVAMQIDADLLVGRSSVEISRSAVAAIRAALLRSATRIWVATDERGGRWLVPDEWQDDPTGAIEQGEAWRLFPDRKFPPDGCTIIERYALVPHPEGKETPT